MPYPIVPYTIMKFANEPIVMVTVYGAYNAAVHFRISQKVGDLLDRIAGKVYRINDMTHAHLDLLDMVDVVTQMTMCWPGTASDPRIISYMVLNGGNSALAVAYLRKCEGWQRVYVFASLAQALACARGPIIMETEETIRQIT